MSRTIALVDDDRNILTSVSMALESEGFTVNCYSDGEEALAGLNRNPVDLAVLDIKMPRMDGMELLQKIRADSKCPVDGEDWKFFAGTHSLLNERIDRGQLCARLGRRNRGCSPFNAYARQSEDDCPYPENHSHRQCRQQKNTALACRFGFRR